MNVQDILKHIDGEIARLQRVRDLLAGAEKTNSKVTSITAGRRKRFLSADARKRIGNAQRKRWAKVHAAAKKAA